MLSSNQDQSATNEIRMALRSEPFCCGCCGLYTGLMVLFALGIVITALTLLPFLMLGRPGFIAVAFVLIIKVVIYVIGTFALSQVKRSYLKGVRIGLASCIALYCLVAVCMVVYFAIMGDRSASVHLDGMMIMMIVLEAAIIILPSVISLIYDCVLSTMIQRAIVIMDIFKGP